MLEKLIAWDIEMLNAIREFFWMDWSGFPLLITILSDIQVFAFAILLIVYWLTGAKRKDDRWKLKALGMFYVVVGAFIVYLILNQFLPERPRPESVAALPPLINHLPDNSFPSGHAIFAAAVCVALWFFSESKFITNLFLALGMIMVMARIVSGIHYPGDIVVGLIVGIISAIVVHPIKHTKFYKKFLLPIPLKIASLVKL